MTLHQAQVRLSRKDRVLDLNGEDGTEVEGRLAAAVADARPQDDALEAMTGTTAVDPLVVDTVADDEQHKDPDVAAAAVGASAGNAGRWDHLAVDAGAERPHTRLREVVCSLMAQPVSVDAGHRRPCHSHCSQRRIRCAVAYTGADRDAGTEAAEAQLGRNPIDAAALHMSRVVVDGSPSLGHRALTSGQWLMAGRHTCLILAVDATVPRHTNPMLGYAQVGP